MKRIELKQFKATTIEVAYAKRAMSKRLDGSQVHSTHSSLWADLGTIIMDYVADLSSSSTELEFVNGTSNPVVIKQGQIVATAIQIDCMTLNQTMINQYHWLNQSSLVLRTRTTSCFIASSQTKRWTEKKKKSFISTWK